MAKVRIYEVTTETADDGCKWSSHRVAAPSATAAIAKASKQFSKAIQEQLLEVRLLASED